MLGERSLQPHCCTPLDRQASTLAQKESAPPCAALVLRGFVSAASHAGIDCCVVSSREALA